MNKGNGIVREGHRTTLPRHDLDQLAQVFETSDCIWYCSTFHTEDDIIGAFLDDIDNTFPIHNTVTTSTTHGCTGYFPFFCTTLRKTNIFGMQVNQPVYLHELTNHRYR